MDSKGDDGDVMERGQVEQSPTANHSLKATSTFSTLPGSVSSFLSFAGYNKDAQKASNQNLCRTVNSFVRGRSINREVKVRKCKESIFATPTTAKHSVYSCPEGYPRLAAFLDSDENFMVYRRFGYLQSRLLLEKQ